MGCGCGGGRAKGSTVRYPGKAWKHVYPQAGGHASVVYWDEEQAHRAQAKLGGSVELINPNAPEKKP